MFEPLLVRAPVVPSRLYRRLQRLAAGLCLLTAGLLAVAAVLQRDVLSPAFFLLIAALVLTLLAVGLLLRGRRTPHRAVALTIGADGTITVATAATGESLVMRPAALTPLSVVLRGRDTTLVVWRDSLPAEGFRRLSAVVRWHVDRRAAQIETA
ncbi:MAG: hypothetical protein ING59_18580 [Burkholderiales bacterium]|nr:hypothetical protein [Burkholderiales bacterium]